MAIILSGIRKTFTTDDRVIEAVRPVDLHIERGTFTGILGPSGCGKTTLLRIIADLETPTEGTVSVMGSTPNEARLHRTVGIVFQRPALLPWRSVTENIALPAEIAGVENVDGEDIPQRVRALIELVGLDGFEKAFPEELSGGMQSRVGIARALVLKPTVLLLDEPFAALDQITREHMQVELARICDTEDLTAMLVTHSIPEAIFLGDRVLVMSARPGGIIADKQVDFPRPRTVDILEASEFNHLAQELRALLF